MGSNKPRDLRHHVMSTGRSRGGKGASDGDDGADWMDGGGGCVFGDFQGRGGRGDPSDPQGRTSVATEPRLDGCGCTEGEGPPVVHVYIDVRTLG